MSRFPEMMDALDQTGVTEREREVLRLLGDRLTNAEIADRLFISVRTVESHVSSLLMKLGAANRRDLGAFRAAALMRGFPVPQSPLIGRGEEIDRILSLLDRFRLVTLTGIGGSGKTRLGIEVGSRVADDHPSGAVFVDVAPVTDPELIPVALASRLGFEHARVGTGLDQRLSELVDRLAEWKGVIVLDNCEHVLAATAKLASRLMSDCPGVRLLVTSREGFGIPGEAIHAVPLMQIPVNTETAAGVESIVLFLERAQALRPDLDLMADHSDAAIEICQRLDGLPLAIELAAVQLVHLTPEELASRLGGMHDVLGARPGADPRHGTLRIAMDWSYELLSENERVFFSRLSVFVGWVRIDAVERVCMSIPLDHEDATELIGSLVWKSLLVVTSHGASSRYRMLETVRTYGLERLEESGEKDRVRRAHLDWCLEAAEEAVPHLEQAESARWLDVLEANLDNLRAGLKWAVTGRDGEHAARLFNALWRYWHMRGDIGEGRRWAEQVLTVAALPNMARARALEAAGGLAYWGGDMASSQRLYEEALDIVRIRGSEVDLANSLYNAAFSYGFGGETDRALRYLDEALAIYQTLDDDEGVAKSLWGWGACAQSAEMFNEARPRLEGALELLDSIDNTFLLGWAHWMLANVYIKLGEVDEARPHLASALQLFAEAGDVSGMIMLLQNYARLSLDEDDPERVVILVGALGALQDTSGMDLLTAFSEQIEGLHVAFETLGSDRSSELLKVGREMSGDQVLEFASSA